MTNNSCKDCNERVIGCHSSCEKYLNYKAQKDKECAARQANKGFKTLSIRNKKRKTIFSTHRS